MRQDNQPEMKKPRRLIHVGALKSNVINNQEENVMTNHSTAIATAKIIPFRQKELLLIDNAGEPFVPMKPVVEGMGLDWKSQHVKLNSGRFNSSMAMITTVAEDGKRREMACLPLRKLAGWLMSIHASKVRPELREGVIAFQNECDDVLWSYWNDGIAARHDDRPVETVLSQTLGTDGFRCLASVLDGKVRHLPVKARQCAKMHVWSQVHKAFSVVSAEDIPASQLDAARNFIAAYAIEGEWLPKKDDLSGVGIAEWSNIGCLINCIEQTYEIFNRYRLCHYLSGLGCKAGAEMLGFLWDGLGSAAHVKKHCANELASINSGRLAA